MNIKNILVIKKYLNNNNKLIFEFLDEFDKLYREKIRGDKEIVGLMTGIPISDFIADLILTAIDKEIIELSDFKAKKFDFFHFKDNYNFIFYVSDNSVVFNVAQQIKDIFSKYKYNIKFMLKEKIFLLRKKRI